MPKSLRNYTLQELRDAFNSIGTFNAPAQGVLTASARRQARIDRITAEINRREDEYPWTCPNCKADNVDIERWTALPMCSECSTTISWTELRQED
jgi:hypothetical protein